MTSESIAGNRTSGTADVRSAQSAQSDQGSAAWFRTLAILRKHSLLASVFAACVFATVMAVTFMTKPVYEPSSTIEVEPPGTQAFTLDGRGARASNAEYLETQSKSLQSDQLALAVIRRLHLNQNPEFVELSPKKNEPASQDGTAQQPTPMETAALISFQDRLKVKRDTSSQLITVSFASHDPRTAALVTNTLVREYIDSSRRSQHEAITDSSAWLSQQLDDIRIKMRQSNQTLTAFQRATGIADVDSNRNTVAERMAELDRHLGEAQSDRILSESYLQGANASQDSLPQVRENPVYQELSKRLAEAKSDLSQAQVLYGKNHPVLKKQQKRVDELQSELAYQNRAALSELKTRYTAAKSREQLLRGELQNSTKALSLLAQYNALRKEAQTETDLYNSLYAKIKEAEISASSLSNNIRVLDEARILNKPTKPQIPLNLGFGLLAGVIGGIMLAFSKESFGKESFNNTIHSVEEIRDATGVSTVSVLPIIEQLEEREAVLPASAYGARYDKLKHSAFLLNRPHSMEAEAVRGLHASIMLAGWGAPPQVLLVTSAIPGEGKTTVASNLAVALSRRGPTCLVNADLRKRSDGKLFGVGAEYGWYHMLEGSAGVDQAICEVPDIPNLSIVAAGVTANDAPRIMSEHLVSEIIESLRQRFQFVVLDSPPILPYVDGRVLSTLSDGLIFVGRYGTTPRSVLLRSMELLADVQSAPILDVVLNAAQLNPDDYHYYSGKY